MADLKTDRELALMAAAGRIVGEILATLAQAAQPGVRLLDLDARAAQIMAAHGAQSSFRGYQPAWAPRPYPGVVCLSVNDEIVHGVPGRRTLRAGDLLSIDCGASVEGYHADAALTVAVGAIDQAARRLCETTAAALAAGIAAAQPGGHLGDISAAVECVARVAGYGQPDGLGGHGIGRSMHEDPHLSNTGHAGRGLPLRPGLVLAIEPMLTEGRDSRHRTRSDGWTVATLDGGRAAHFEHTVAITADGPRILTIAP